MTIVPPLVKTHTGLERSIGPLLGIGIALDIDRLEVPPGLIESALVFEKKISETQMSVKTHPASGVTLDDRSPDFDRLLSLLGFEAGISGLEQFSSGSIFDDGTSDRSLLRLRVDRSRDVPAKEHEKRQPKPGLDPVAPETRPCCVDHFHTHTRRRSGVRFPKRESLISRLRFS